MEKSLNIFFCYAHEDEMLLKELQKHLSALIQQHSFITLWDDRNIDAGTDRVEAINRYLDSAHLILLLISPDFLASKNCGSQVRRAMERQKYEQGQVNVIPIILRQVDWKGTPFSRLETLPKNAKPVTSASWNSADEAWHDVTQGIRILVEKQQNKREIIIFDNEEAQPQNNPTGVVPPPFPPIWNVPYRSNTYFDLTNVLKQIHEGLQSRFPLIHPLVLTGPGGVGKTRVAAEYAYCYRENYDAVLWINAASRDILQADYIALADELDLPERSERDQNSIRKAVGRWFADHTGWLLVLDNADDLNMVNEFIPTAYRGHILLTSRAHAAGDIGTQFKLTPLQPDEGTLFLLRRAKILHRGAPLEDASEQDCHDARTLAYEMGGLPLALSQAGAYIEETDCGVSGYIEVYRTHARKLLADPGDIISEHPIPVATTWLLAFKSIEKNKIAAASLRLCAFLHPDSIPEELLLQDSVSSDTTMPPLATDPYELDQAMRELYHFSLIQRNKNSNIVTIHRLVQEVVRNLMDTETQRAWGEYAVRAVYVAFPDVDQASSQNCHRYLSHVFICKDLIEKWHLSFVEAARLMYRAGFYHHEHMQYKQAIALYEQAIAIYEQHPEENVAERAIAVKEYKRLLDEERSGEQKI